MKKFIYKNGALKKIKSSITKKGLIVAGVIVFAVLLITPIVTYANYARDIRDPDRLMNKKNTGIILRDKHGEIFYKYGKINGNDDIKLDQISNNLEKALIASEDREFFKHEGYSIKGIVRALYANVLNQDPSKYGGSTITQQLVKNKLLSSDKNYFRKYQEVSMAMAVERHYSKADILEMYLNSVYFGEGAFGVSDAAKTYFNKSPNDLTVAESSALVAILPAPTAYSPISGDKKQAKELQGNVLRKMVSAGVIDEKTRQAAIKQPLAFAPPKQTEFKHAQHYTMMVIEQLRKQYGEEEVTRAGFDVTTGLDLGWQKNAEQKIKEKVAKMQAAGGRNAGLVAIDPKSGEIRTLVGSANWDDTTFGKVNMAVSARQPGSSFKPIYYTEAMDKRLITPATIMNDAPKTYGGTYKPENYDFKFRGELPVRNALAQSLNIPSVDVMQKLGPEAASAAAQRMGISTVTEPQKYGLSLGLGTAETKLLEMTNAYAAFANQGNQYDPRYIISIKNKYGQSIKRNAPTSKRVMSPEATFLMSSILSDNNARAPTFGNNLTIPNKQVAVKTGTTNDSRDAWTIGYTPNLTMGVWVGNNENQPMVGLAGSSSAGAIWKDNMADSLKNMPDEKFQPNVNIMQLKICKGNGKKATAGSPNAYDEYFIRGTEPKEDCTSFKPKEEEKRREDDKQEEKKPEQREETEEKPRENDNGNGGRGGDTGGATGPSPPPVEEPDPEPEPTPEPTPTPTPTTPAE